MASIQKIERRKKNGKISTYWVVRYYDSDGKQRRKNHKKQSTANAHRITIESELLTGAHISNKASTTVSAAADHFINSFERDMQSGRRERSTWKQYRSHIKLHIATYPVASTLLNTLRAPECRVYLDALQEKIGDSQAAKVMVTFRMILSYAAERGWIQGNPATTVKLKRQTRKVKVVTFPEKKDVKELLDTAEAMGAEEHAFCCLGFFCGLRPSELRGLPVTAIRPGNVVIEQRADEWGKIGPPKTPKSRRTIPMGKYTAKIVDKWLKDVTGPLLFPSENQTPMSYQNLYNRFWKPLHIKAGLYTPAVKADPKTGIIAAPESGTVYTLHTMRHVAASLWIEEMSDNPKKVQEWLGHATLAMTMDTYGHLFKKSRDNRKHVNKAENSVLCSK